MNTSTITPRRGRELHEVARRIPTHDHDCVLVGIDGVDGAGKTVFADHLAHVLRAAGPARRQRHEDRRSD